MVATLGGIAIVLLALWALDGFQGFDLDAGATVTVVVGIAVVSALGTGLMGLVFYSDRTNADEDAYHVTAPVDGQAASLDQDENR
jgi:hypothetical protein